MGAVVTLTTDFGLGDAYVAAMKGVILGINPEAKLVDICHTIRPQNIHQAAFVLGMAYQFFPRGTIHLAVVDPGVGTERRAIILRTPAACFVAPDNGVLTYVIRDYSTELIDDSSNQQEVRVGSKLEAVAITRPEYWRSPVSSTFHGRDIFAPVAARLSLGVSAKEFGETITSFQVLPYLHPYRGPDGSLIGHILHVDGFGNLVTDIRGGNLLQAKQEITIEVGNQLVHGLSSTYADNEGLLALIDSNGYLEISLKGGSAYDYLNVEVGDDVKIR
jgi:S-adenosylmethionine hydrolase